MRDSIKRMIRQAADWEKIFASYILNKGLVSRIYEELSKLTNKKNSDLCRKLARHIQRHYNEEDIQIANIHRKRCSTALIIREMQVKTTMRYYTVMRITKIKNSDNTKCW